MRSFTLQIENELVSQTLEWLQQPTSPEGAMLYAAGLLTVGLIGILAWKRRTTQEEPEVDFSDVLDEETLEAGHGEGQLLDDIAESHKTTIAPAAVEWETRAAHVGEQWTTTLSITDYPDYPNDGYLSDLFQLTDVEFDLTAHIRQRTSSVL